MARAEGSWRREVNLWWTDGCARGARVAHEGMSMIERMRGESALSSGGKFIAAAIAVAVLAHFGHGPTHDHRNVIYLWLAAGMVSPILVPLYPRIVAATPA